MDTDIVRFGFTICLFGASIAGYFYGVVQGHAQAGRKREAVSKANINVKNIYQYER